MIDMKKSSNSMLVSPIEASSTSVTASEAKNEFGRVLERVISGGVMFITKHGAAKAVLMPVDRYNALARAGELQLSALTEQFDELLLRMQTPKARAGMKKAFHASPKRLGKAALAAARSRG
jgi:antitoxin Phd